VQPAQFKKIEEDALKDFSRPESYELLATSFGNTTEKVWAVIYGEVYCNLSDFCPFCCFRPICPVEPISVFYGQDGREAYYPIANSQFMQVSSS
jgi:hypothetical protein